MSNAEKSKPLTISAEREAEIRNFEYKTEATKDLLKELDAQMAAPANGAACVPQSQPDGESIADASGFEGGKL